MGKDSPDVFHNVEPKEECDDKEDEQEEGDEDIEVVDKFSVYSHAENGERP